jgi:hypothetical protein
MGKDILVSDSKISQNAIPKIHSKAFKNWDFWYATVPSGNPGKNLHTCAKF